jgi:ribosome recycling factor
MAYDFSQLEQKIKETQEWLQGEFFSIRTGQATPAILDNLKVDSYGVLAPINQVASIGIEDARTLRVTPFDASQVKEIEKAITTADTGLSVSADEKGVRVSFPELTTENRAQLTKVVREKLEQARVSLRKERDEVWTQIQKQEKEGTLSEDEKFTYKDEMQKIIDESNKALESLASAKETELKG